MQIPVAAKGQTTFFGLTMIENIFTKCNEDRRTPLGDVAFILSLKKNAFIKSSLCNALRDFEVYAPIKKHFI